jgi:hypothetical protein
MAIASSDERYGAAFVMRAKPAEGFFITSERFQNRAHGRNCAGVAAGARFRPVLGIVATQIFSDTEPTTGA